MEKDVKFSSGQIELVLLVKCDPREGRIRKHFNMWV